MFIQLFFFFPVVDADILSIINVWLIPIIIGINTINREVFNFHFPIFNIGVSINLDFLFSESYFERVRSAFL